MRWMNLEPIIQSEVSQKEKVVFIVQPFSYVWLLATPWTAAGQASQSFTLSQSLLKLLSIESVMPFNHLVLCRPVLLLPSIFPSIRIFSNELALCIRWPKYWGFSFSISPSNEYSGLTGLIFSNITVQKHQFFSAQPSFWSNSHTHTRLLEKP